MTVSTCLPEIKDSVISNGLSWENIHYMKNTRLYAGDVPQYPEYNGLIGLSKSKNDNRHIRHDIRNPFPVNDSTMDSFQAEDVFQCIPYEILPKVVNEIYRILKPGGLFRLSIPDYGCDVLQNRSIKNKKGQIIFDPGGGGTPENPGHIWFPRIDTVKYLLENSKFAQFGMVEYLHYYNMDGTFELKPIDYSKGYIRRTPDFDRRVKNPYRPMSLIVDLIKGKQTSHNIDNIVLGVASNQETDNRLQGTKETCNNGFTLLQQGHITQALDIFCRISSLTPQVIDAHIGRAISFARLGRLLEAEVAMREACSVNKQNSKLKEYLQHFRRLKHTLDGDRDLEWGWARQQIQYLAAKNITNLEILDFGCGRGAEITRFAAQYGFKITATDMLPLRDSIDSNPNISFIQADFLVPDWPKQKYDVIINCSAVEHAGLAGRYAVVKSEPDADLKIMTKMAEIIKPQGKMLLVIPVGQDKVVGSLHRIYGPQRIKILLDKWQIESSIFWVKDEYDKWINVDFDSAMQRDGILTYGIGCFILHPAEGNSIADTSCCTVNKHNAIPLKQLSVNNSISNVNSIKPKSNLNMQVIGSKYGGWAVDLDLIPEGSTVISAGVGEDISFDLGLINLKKCNILGIDPTEKAAIFIANNRNKHFGFIQKALHSYSGEKIKMFKSNNPEYVSESITSSHQTVKKDDWYKVQTISIQDLIQKFDNISVLKMDIEGAEYAVLNSLQKLDIPQVCVEFHHFCTDYTINDTMNCISHLNKLGYVMAHHTNMSGQLKEATFVHDKYLSGRKIIDANTNR